MTNENNGGLSSGLVSDSAAYTNHWGTIWRRWQHGWYAAALRLGSTSRPSHRSIHMHSGPARQKIMDELHNMMQSSHAGSKVLENTIVNIKNKTLNKDRQVENKNK